MIVSIVVLTAFVFAVFRYVVQCDKKRQRKMDALRDEISKWPHEKLVYVWGEYDKICSIQGVGISPLYFEMLGLLEDECRKRGFKS